MFRLTDARSSSPRVTSPPTSPAPHLEQQRLAIARGAQRPAGGVDAHAELIRRRGDAHEAAAYARLAAEAGGVVVDLAEEFDVRDRGGAGARGRADRRGDGAPAPR